MIISNISSRRTYLFNVLHTLDIRFYFARNVRHVHYTYMVGLGYSDAAVDRGYCFSNFTKKKNNII